MNRLNIFGSGYTPIRKRKNCWRWTNKRNSRNYLNDGIGKAGALRFKPVFNHFIIGSSANLRLVLNF